MTFRFDTIIRGVVVGHMHSIDDTLPVGFKHVSKGEMTTTFVQLTRENAWELAKNINEALRTPKPCGGK